MRTLYPNGTIIYTPFPDYELTDPPGSGADTVRTTYRLGGQIVAVQTKVARRRARSTTPTPTIWATLRLWGRVAALWRVP